MAKAIELEHLPVLTRDYADPAGMDFSKGAVVPVDKAAGWTSFDVVKKLRGLLKVKKVGHAGTLDPAATGLLILCTGKATKSIEQIQQLPKWYRAVIRFGASTPSYDAETPIDSYADWEFITEEHIRNLLDEEFTGEISQTVPPYSAVKVNGERLYKKARRGEETELKTRQVHVHKTDIVEYRPPDVTVDIKCSKGTYIRSIAHDLGLALGSGAYLAALRRTAIGHFRVEEAMEIPELEERTQI